MNGEVKFLLKIKKMGGRFGGSVWGSFGGGGQGRCEHRSEVFVKIQEKKYIFFWGGDRVGGSGLM